MTTMMMPQPFREILGQSQNSEISAILPYEISSFNFDLKFL